MFISWKIQYQKALYIGLKIIKPCTVVFFILAIGITIFYTLTFCKRSTSIAFTPVLSKSRFSNSERNSVTFKSQAFRGSNFSDILIERKLYSVFKYIVFTQKSIANLLRNVFSTLFNILLIETSTATVKMKMKPKIWGYTKSYYWASK